MIPLTGELQAWLQWASTSLAIAGLLRWLAGDHGAQSDAEIIEAHELVLQQLADADSCRTIECITERDLRSQLTVEQIVALQREVDLLKRAGERN